MIEQQSDWLETGVVSQILPFAPIMRPGAYEGRNRKWYTDGAYIWFRRKEANPETVARHNRFMAAGDYEYLGTEDEVEIYGLNEQSRFHIAGANTRVVDLDKLWAMGQWQVKRLAAIAAVERKWDNFVDLCGFVRERVRERHGANTAAADLEYADFTEWLFASITQRLGPSAGEIQKEVGVIAAKRRMNVKGRVITLG